MAQRANQSAKSSSAVDADIPFYSMPQNNFIWIPYRAAARMMGRSEHSIELMVQANRKLADTLREIVRREQDTLLGLSERTLKNLVDGPQKSNGEATATAFVSYQTALEGAREFSQAIVEAQTESFAALREYAQGTIETGRKAAADFKTAA